MHVDAVQKNTNIRKKNDAKQYGLLWVILFVGFFLLLALMTTPLSLRPIVWNDSLSFIESSVLSVRAKSLRALHGVGSGYVVFIGFFIKNGLDFSLIIAAQYFFLLLTIGSVAIAAVCCIEMEEKRYFFVAMPPLIILATYSGLQIYANILYAEILYVVLVTLSLVSIIVAFSLKSSIRVVLWLLLSLSLAALAAITKSQGLAILFVATLLSLWVAIIIRNRAVLFAWLFVCCVVWAFVFLAAANARQTQDASAQLFGPKTLFCFQLNNFLQAEEARAHALRELGPAAAEFELRIKSAYRSTEGQFETLGFYADACQFDTTIDELAISQLGGVSQLASWYWRAFLSAIAEKPMLYAKKVASQVLYALKMAVPPHGVISVNGGVDERRKAAVDLLEAASFGAIASGLGEGAVAGPFLGRGETLAVVYLYRVVSVIVGVALLVPFVAMFFKGFRRTNLLRMGLVSSMYWFAQVGAVALTHTLDIWRYLVPVVPAALLCTALMGSMLIRRTLRIPCAA